MRGNKKKGCLIVFALFLFGLGPTIGQSPPFSFKHFFTREGLSDLSIQAIIRDRDDHLWIGTPSGLYIFNGSSAQKFENNALPVNVNITCLYFLNPHTLLAGTFSDGLYQINPVDHSVIPYVYDQKNREGISANRIHGILKNRKGQILIALEKEGLDVFDPATGVFHNHRITNYIDHGNVNLHNTVLSMDIDPGDEQVVWLGTLDGLFKFHVGNNEMTHFRCQPSNTLQPEMLNARENIIKSIQCENDLIYTGTWGGGLCVFDKKTGVWSSYKFQSPFPSSGMRNDVVQILPKSEDEFWVVAYRQEIGVFDKKNRSFSFHGYPDIKTMHRDSLNHIWFGTLGKGLYAWFPEMETFQKKHLPFQLTKMRVHPQKNTAYAGIFGENRLLEIDLKTNKYRTYSFSPFYDLEINFISDLQFVTHDKLYLLGQTGVYCFDESTHRISKVFSPIEQSETVSKNLSSTAFLIDKKNNLWYATKFNGLYRFNLNNRELMHYKPDKDQGHTAWISDLFEDHEGRIWYGSGKGFGFYDYGKQTFSGYPESRTFCIPDSLDFGSITSITEDPEGNIWIGDLKKGLGKLNFDKSKIIRSYTVESAPMLNDVILEVHMDDLGHLWFRTREGICRLLPEADHFDHFGDAYGLKGVHSITNGRDGRVLLSSSDGYYIFTSETPVAPMDKPRVKLDRFLVFNSEYKTEIPINELDEVRLDHRQNYFSVEYGCSDFSYPHLIRYRYKMKGFHDEWIDAGTRRSASFSNLNGGVYQLQISAGYGENLFGENKTLSIYVHPPFWQNRWFWLISLSALVLIIWFLVSRRIRSIKKKAALKSKFEKRLSEAKLAALQAQINPHFLFNCLNSIKSLTIENKVDEASDYLTRFSRLIRYSLNHANHLLVPLKDEIDALRLYIEMESLRFNHEFSYIIDVDASIDKDKVSVPPMMLQVFVENAIKHGLRPKEEDKNLEILFRLSGKSMICIIRDNGVGRKKAEAQQATRVRKKESLGIRNTMERLAQLKSVHQIDISVQIQDLHMDGRPAGTQVDVIFPL